MPAQKSAQVKSKQSRTQSARTKRGDDARDRNMATGRGKATPSKTAETSKRRAQPTARPRNAAKDRSRPGDTKDMKGKATYELESSNPAKRPSRKSSRGGANRAKPDSQLKRRQTRAVRSPSARSQSRAG